MQKEITIKYASGDMATYVAYPPDFAKWERETKKSITEFAGIWDILFVAHSAMKREAAGKPVKAFDVWMETVADVEVGDSSPKAISPKSKSRSCRSILCIMFTVPMMCESSCSSLVSSSFSNGAKFANISGNRITNEIGENMNKMNPIIVVTIMAKLKLKSL